MTFLQLIVLHIGFTTTSLVISFLLMVIAKWIDKTLQEGFDMMQWLLLASLTLSGYLILSKTIL